MVAPIDSAAVINTGNQVVSIINFIWPVVASVLAYLIGHWRTSRPKKITLPKV